ncbi:MAG: Gfo/Idh/MocA family protein [Halanaerobiales bacterium]
MDKVKVGIIGCGNISSIYFENCNKFEILEVTACADLVREKAEKQAEKYNIPKVCTTEELLNDPEIEIVLNLTTPGVHAEVCLAALEAGKNVHVEKPLAVKRKEGKKILNKAGKKGLLVGGAPDTFMGGGIQTCRKLIDDGWIGEPIGATAFMMCHGHESWHPDPEFYYKTGGGPMFDMGPYYLTALIALIGPVNRVTGSTSKALNQRTITSKPKFGKKIEVEVPTHVSGLMDFENGATGSIITSFDVWGARLPRIEIYGTDGSLSVPDPNTFGGPVHIFKPDQGEWEKVPLTHGFTENSRGIGVADMAYALRSENREHRPNGKMAYHVLDIMHSFHDASEKGEHINLESSCEKPAPLPLGLPDYALDK